MGLIVVKEPFHLCPLPLKLMLTPSFIMDSLLQLLTKLLIPSPTCIIFFSLMPKGLQNFDTVPQSSELNSHHASFVRIVG
jgi:hypothetical protein